MEKKNFSDYEYKRIIYTGTGAKIYQIDNDLILKKMNPMILDILKTLRINYEAKIFNTRAESINEIVKPITAIYENNECVGYTMKKIKGKKLNDYFKKLTVLERANLEMYTDIYIKLENIIKKANQKGIVFPDICTIKNIFINKNNDINLIDYDGMQFGKRDSSICMSTLLGDPNYYSKLKKYSERKFNYTKELDKKSLTILLFLYIFNIDLNNVGTINPKTNKILTLDDIFYLLNINDNDFFKKVKANLSTTEQGYYLGDNLKDISENYNMIVGPKIKEQTYIKRLIKK